jgi:penicillin-insensitive murein DD-endopeptidase
VLVLGMAAGNTVHNQSTNRAQRYSRGTLRVWCGLWVSVGFVVASPPSAAAPDEVPERYRQYPYSVMSLSVGAPNRGYHIRSKKLSDTLHLVVKNSSTKYRYGHPALVLMLRRSAREISRSGKGVTMLVGDLSREEGGALYGHRSHQSGRDADVAFYALDSRGNSVKLKEFVKFDANGTSADGVLRFDDYRNWLLVQAWVTDHRAGLSHIFVSHGLRARLLSYAQQHPKFRIHIPAAMQLLKQPEHGEPHDDHFHVRIACPKDQVGLCKNESAPF